MNYNLNNPLLKLKIYNKINNKLVIKIIIIIISSLLLLLLLKEKFDKAKFILNIYKELKNKNDIIIFMKNKTNFYLETRKRYFKNLNIVYNESNLKTFQDKLNYLIIHESPEYKSNLVDKIKIHEYSKKILGKDICVPILKIYNNINEINLDELPNKFILKCNHGSGMNVFCKDKSNFDITNAKKS